MRRALALVACTALALAGCASLPTSSAPTTFDVSARDGSGIQFSAEGPVDGSDASTLVTDFLRACAAGTQDDYATARLFLTASSARDWQPETEILVYDTDTAPSVNAGAEVASQTEVNVSVLGVASIDATGVLTRSNGATVSRTLTLVREGGQWRIDAPENMILVSRAALTASYSLANLYFPTTDGTDLVADPRWYPSRRLASHLLAGLIAGPRPSLASAVSNAIPAGATLPSHGVEVADGVANVELNGPMLRARGTREPCMAADANTEAGRGCGAAERDALGGDAGQRDDPALATVFPRHSRGCRRVGRGHCVLIGDGSPSVGDRRLGTDRFARGFLARGVDRCRRRLRREGRDLRGVPARPGTPRPVG